MESPRQFVRWDSFKDSFGGERFLTDFAQHLVQASGSFPCLLTSLDNLGAFRRFRFTHGLVKPNLVSEWIHHCECAVSPPLVGKRRSYFDCLLLQLVMVGIDVGHFEIDFNRTFRGRSIRPFRPLLWAH